MNKLLSDEEDKKQIAEILEMNHPDQLIERLVIEQAYLVLKDVRSAAEVAILPRQIERVKEIAATYDGIKVYISDCPEAFKGLLCNVLIYKYPQIELIFKFIEKNRENKVWHSETDFICQWMLGKMFGYAEHDILEYLKRANYLPEE